MERTVGRDASDVAGVEGGDLSHSQSGEVRGSGDEVLSGIFTGVGLFADENRFADGQESGGSALDESRSAGRGA